MPIMLLILIYIWNRSVLDGQGGPLLLDTIKGAVIALATLALSLAGISAAVAPSRREWRLLPESNESATVIRARVMILAIVVAADVFLWTALTNETKSPEFITVYAMLACAARALALLPLLHGRLRRLQTFGVSAESDARRPSRIWMAARITAGAAAGLGYADLALFVARGLTASLVIIGGLLLLRGAIHEATSTAMHTDAALSWIGVSHDTAETLAFWVRLLLEPLFIAVAVVLLGPFWGMTQQEMLTRAGTLLSGFKVGDVTISCKAIGFGLLVFVIILALIRAIQRAMLTITPIRDRLFNWR